MVISIHTQTLYSIRHFSLYLNHYYNSASSGNEHAGNRISERTVLHDPSHRLPLWPQCHKQFNFWKQQDTSRTNATHRLGLIPTSGKISAIIISVHHAID
jgi:hypothetical protein